MIRADQLPIEVMNEFHAALLHGESYAEAFAAALNAWPDVVDTHPNNIGHIVLQFKEVSDE